MMAGVTDPTKFSISTAKRRRYLAALKRVIDEFDPFFTGVDGEEAIDPDWYKDGGGEDALVELFQILGGVASRHIDTHIPELFTLKYEKNNKVYSLSELQKEMKEEVPPRVCK